MKISNDEQRWANFKAMIEVVEAIEFREQWLRRIIPSDGFDQLEALLQIEIEDAIDAGQDLVYHTARRVNSA